MFELKQKKKEEKNELEELVSKEHHKIEYESDYNKRKKEYRPEIVVALLLIVAALLIFRAAYTGLFIYGEISYSGDLNLTFNETTTYNILLNASPLSLKLSGAVIGNGEAKVYLLDNGIKKLVVDSSKLQTSYNLITAYTVAEEFLNESANGTSDLTGISPNETTNQTNNLTEITNTTPVIPENITEPSLTNQTPENITQPIQNPEPIENITTNHAPEWISSIESFIVTGNLTINLSQYFVDLDNDALSYIVSEPSDTLILKEFEMITVVPDSNIVGNRTMRIFASDLKNTTEKEITLAINTIKQIAVAPLNTTIHVKLFDSICIDTCFLTDIGRNITLLIEVTNATLNLTKLEYTAKPENISLNNPPQCSLIQNINVSKNQLHTIWLDNYCSDADNDTLSYDVSLSSKDVDTMITDDMVTFIPRKNFIGTAFLSFVVNDSKNITFTNIIVINVTGNITNVTEKKRNATINLKNNKKEKIGRYKLINRSDETFDLELSNLPEDKIREKKDSKASIKGIKELKDADVLIDDISDDRIKTQAFAINESLDFNNAEITLIKNSDVNAIFYCADFDFDMLSCSDWQRTDIPFVDNGDTVTFNVTHFSAYAGGIVILNVRSYPSLYGNWTVEFETEGTANLTITATNEPNYTSEYTRWSNESEDETIYDLRFLDVRCGNETKQYEWVGNNCSEQECSVFIANYTCNIAAQEISKVLTPKLHVLKFNFGGQIAYAYNTVGNETSESGVDEWRMFHRYLNHTGYTDSSSPTNLSLANVITYTTTGIIESSPAVANGYVYIGSDDAKLYQLNASNIAQLIASFSAGGAIDSSPAVANGYVYVLNYNTTIYQLNASNVSQLIASFSTGGGMYSQQSSPAVANGYVYVGSTGNVLYQLNATNISQYVANFTAGDAIYPVPAVANGYVYIGSNDRNVYQLNASNVSQKIANYTLGGTIYGSPAVANGYVYIGSDDTNLYQLNASNVSIFVANYSTGGAIRSSPAVANGYVYVGSNDNKTYQFNATNISLLVASYTTGGNVRSSPAVTNKYVFIGSDDDRLYQFNATNISIFIASQLTSGNVYSSPAVANGSVYIGSNDNKVYQFALDIQTPSINFTQPPTLPNGTTTTNTSVEINISITNASDLSEFTWSWNGSNYTFYNDSLVLMMNFDNVSALGENSSSNFTYDASRYGNNGTCTGMGNSCNWTTGKYGRALSLDGVNDWVNISNPKDFNFGANSFAIMAWIKFTGLTGIGTTENILAFYTTANQAIQFAWHIDNLTVWGETSTVLNTQGFSPTLDSWYHVAFVRDGNNWNIYVNGSSYASATDTRTLNPRRNDVGIGFLPTSLQYFNGSIDEFRVYNRSLNATEIQQHYYSNFYKYDTDKWVFYSNQTNLTDGTYTYQGFVKDVSGNTNQTDLRYLNVDVTTLGINFTQPPTLPNGTTTTNRSAEINISIWNASDLAEFTWNWNGSNYTFYNDSLVLMMNFDNVSAIGENNTLAVDVSRYGNNGTITNGATWVTNGKYSEALQFDGTNDYVNFTTFNSMSTGTAGRTMCAWVKRAGNGTRAGGITIDGIAFYGKQATGQAMFMSAGTTTIHVGGFSDDIAISTTWTFGVWRHICLTYDGTNAKVYDDGALINTTAKTWSLVNSEGLIGFLPTQGYWNGTIDEVRIWNRSLSGAEIQQHYYSNFYKYANDSWAFYTNQSNLTEPLSSYNYTYFGCAKDAAGNKNCTETRILTIQAVAPSWSSNSTNATLLKTNQTVYFSINISDNAALNYSIFSFDNGTGTLVNETPIPLNLTTSIVVNITKQITATKSQTIRWTWYANDTAGNWNQTSIWSLVVQNTAPTHTTPILNSSMNLNKTNESLQCFNQSTNDIDSDTITNKIKWFNNSVAVALLENQTAIGAGNTTKLQNWTCEITPYDGTDYGTALNSSILTIANTAPTASNIQTNITLPITNDFVTFNATWVDADVDDLKGYIFSSNFNGSWANETFIAFGGTTNYSNYSKQVPSTYGEYRWRIYANDSDGAWNDTGIQYITVVSNGSEWPMFHHNLRHSGYTASTGPTTNNTRWAYTTNDLVESSAAISNNIIYIGSRDGNLYALNATDGSKIWNFTTKGDVDSSPTIARGVVYVGSSDNKTYALNASTGAHIWNFSTNGSIDSSPTIFDGVVYIGSRDKKAYALNASTGAHIWNYTTQNNIIRSSPAIARGVTYIGSNDGKTYALNATNGNHIWNFSPSTTGVASTIAIFNDVVYTASNNLYALNASTGAHIWNYTTTASIDSSPAIFNGVVYIGDLGNVLGAVNATNGTSIWNITIADMIDYSSPAIANGVLYIGDISGKIYAINATNGTQIWNYSTGSQIESSPAISDGILYIGSDNNKVYAFGSNRAPTIAWINLTSSDPSNRTNGTLIGSWNFSDQDYGDSQQLNETKWYNNSIEVVALRNATSIGAGNTTKGENWTFSIRVYDGEEWSNWSNSSISTILNSVPTHTTPILNSSMNLNKTNESLQCFNQSTNDIDSDTITNKIKWFNNSVAVALLENQTAIGAGNTTKLQNWTCEITPYDGTDYGTALNSSILTIANTAPTALNLILNSTDVLNRTNGTLQGFWTFSDIDGDTQQNNETRWYNNSVEVVNLRNLTVIGSGNTTKLQNWTFSIRVYDGTDWGIWFNSSSIIIPNAAPILNLSIPDQAWSEAGSVAINLSQYFIDIDNDDLNFSSSGLLGISISFNQMTNIVTLTAIGTWYGEDHIMFNATDGSLNATSNNVTLNVANVITCGDNIKEGAEECDDGNTNSGDGCSASCTTEAGGGAGGGGSGGGVTQPGEKPAEQPAEQPSEVPSELPPEQPPELPPELPPQVEYPETITQPQTITIAGIESSINTVPCFNYTENKTVALKQSNITKAMKIPKGYSILINPFSPDCAKGSLTLTFNIPYNYIDVAALKCQGDECSPAIVEETTKLKCGGKIVKEFRRNTTYLEPSLMQVNITKTDLLIKYGKDTIESGKYKIKFLNELNQKVSILMPSEAVKEPENTNLKIIGTPLVVKFENKTEIDAQITLPYVVDKNIENDSLAMYIKIGEVWQYVGGDINYNESKITATIEKLEQFLDGNNQAILAVMGIICLYCEKSELTKVYDPGTSREAVILVHGFERSPERFNDIINDIRLTRQPWQTWTFGYPSSKTIEENGKQFADLLELNANQYDNIYIVAHSLGGLITQEALYYGHLYNYSFVKKARKAVLIASPNKGSISEGVYEGLYNFLMNSKTAELFNIKGNVVKELVYGKAIPEVPGIEYKVIAGTKSYGFVKITQSNDGLVTVESAQSIGNLTVNNSCENYWAINVTHTDILDNIESKQIIERIIAEEVAEIAGEGKSILGSNQYIELNIPVCSSEDTYVIVGKEIKEEKLPDITGCSCGNGYCGLDENAVNCPQDCARIISKENIELLALLALAVVLLMSLIAALVAVYKKIRKHKVGRPLRYTLLSLITAGAAIYLAKSYFVDNKYQFLGNAIAIILALAVFFALFFFSSKLFNLILRFVKTEQVKIPIKAKPRLPSKPLPNLKNLIEILHRKLVAWLRNYETKRKLLRAFKEKKLQELKIRKELEKKKKLEEQERIKALREQERIRKLEEKERLKTLKEIEKQKALENLRRLKSIKGKISEANILLKENIDKAKQKYLEILSNYKELAADGRKAVYEDLTRFYNKLKEIARLEKYAETALKTGIDKGIKVEQLNSLLESKGWKKEIIEPALTAATQQFYKEQIKEAREKIEATKKEYCKAIYANIVDIYAYLSLSNIPEAKKLYLRTLKIYTKSPPYAQSEVYNDLAKLYRLLFKRTGNAR